MRPIYFYKIIEYLYNYILVLSTILYLYIFAISLDLSEINASYLINDYITLI